jgi:hypothetical protein
MIMLTRHAAAVSVLMIILLSASAQHPARAQAGALAYCKADVKRICAGIAPGGGRLVRCLKQHQNDVSIGCAKELKAIKTKMGR